MVSKLSEIEVQVIIFTMHFGQITSNINDRAKMRRGDTGGVRALFSTFTFNARSAPDVPGTLANSAFGISLLVTECGTSAIATF